MFKWNVDGSSKEKPGRAGTGGLLKNEEGDIKGMFVAFVSIRDSNEAEFLATTFALEISLELEWVKDLDLVIESDSKMP